MFFIFILLNLFQPKLMYHIDLSNQSSECVVWIQNHVFDNTQLHLSPEDDFRNIYIGLEHFNQLNDTGCKNLTLETNVLSLSAQRKILIEDNINLTEILNMINVKLVDNEARSIQISNILGFNQYYYHSKLTWLEMVRFEITFDNVNFEFYLNKTPITKEMCKHENFYGKSIEYFWPMTNVIFNYEVTYFQPICPYVFLNSQLRQLGLFQITNSLIFKNCLEFISIDEDNNPLDGLNIHGIAHLDINLVFEELTESNLCPQVFKSVLALEIRGSLYGIQNDLFESFTKIQYLVFRK